MRAGVASRSNAADYARAGSRVGSDSREEDGCVIEDMALMYPMALMFVKWRARHVCSAGCSAHGRVLKKPLHVGAS